jgi:hypothetical protein
MHSAEDMWSEVKKTMHKNWPNLPLRNRDGVWTLLLLSDT